MSLPEFLRKSAEKILTNYCESYRPPFGTPRIQLHFELVGSRATLFADYHTCAECSSQSVPVAQLRFNCDLNQWTLHYRGQTGRWQFYLNAAPSLDLQRLLKTLDEDPLGVFFRE